MGNQEAGVRGKWLLLTNEPPGSFISPPSPGRKRRGSEMWPLAASEEERKREEGRGFVGGGKEEQWPVRASCSRCDLQPIISRCPHPRILLTSSALRSLLTPRPPSPPPPRFLPLLLVTTHTQARTNSEGESESPGCHPPSIAHSDRRDGRSAARRERPPSTAAALTHSGAHTHTRTHTHIQCLLFPLPPPFPPPFSATRKKRHLQVFA